MKTDNVFLVGHSDVLEKREMITMQTMPHELPSKAKSTGQQARHYINQ